MKYTALFLILLLYITFTPYAHAGISNNVRAVSRGGNSSVIVKINNQINTSSNSYSSSKTSTKVEISQTGEGTSQVTINDKEWKLEGPGEIKVDETSDSTNPTPTTAIDESESDHGQIFNPSETTQTQELVQRAFSEMLELQLIKIREALDQFFLKLSNVL